MPSCCGDGQFCDFPWCDCTGNAKFREAHKLVNPGDKEQDCGRASCNYCDQTVRRERAAGVPGALGDGAERRVEAFAEKRLAEIRACANGCGAVGQCKANALGNPSECVARGVGGTDGR